MTMRRFTIPRCVVAALLMAGVGLAAAPSTAVADPGRTCSGGDARALAQAGPHFARKFLESSSSAAAGIWVSCQFRLYDDNEPEDDPDNPEIPHVFTVNDFFLAGIFYFEDVGRDQHRNAAISVLGSHVSRFYFGPSSTPDAQLPQIQLTRTGYRGAVLPLVGGHVVWIHDYVIFEPGSLAPGDYHWRAELDTSVYFGAVTIVAG